MRTLNLTRGEYFSIFYHNIFGYPMSLADLIRWAPGKATPRVKIYPVNFKNGRYFIQNGQFSDYKFLLKSAVSKKKIKIAEKAGKTMSLIPSVKMIAVTGSLAMNNAEPESDIDLFIITSASFLWTTRLLLYLVLKIFGFDVRKSGEKTQKDKLCLNMWMDEKYLGWKKKDQNFYTAHEIAQIVPLVNKNQTYEKFIAKNKWIFNYWPNATGIWAREYRISENTSKPIFHIPYSIFNSFEKFAYRIQKKHMRTKITREIATPTRAIFHPVDLSEKIKSALDY